MAACQGVQHFQRGQVERRAGGRNDCPGRDGRPRRMPALSALWRNRRRGCRRDPRAGPENPERHGPQHLAERIARRRRSQRAGLRAVGFGGEGERTARLAACRPGGAGAPDDGLYDRTRQSGRDGKRRLRRTPQAAAENQAGPRGGRGARRGGAGGRAGGPADRRRQRGLDARDGRAGRRGTGRPGRGGDRAAAAGGRG